MKFKSRKDIVFQLLSLGIGGLFGGVILFRLFSSSSEFVWMDLIMLLMVGFLLWLNFGTEYELTPTELRYKSGPLRGKIKLERIDEIIEGKTLWSGFKPATARNGLIIKYEQYDEIYISPKTNHTFLTKIQELNQDINIISNLENSSSTSKNNVK